MPLPPSAILLSNTNPNKNNIADFPTPILPNLAIAPEFSHLLPDPDLTIAELLEFHLPSQSVSLFVPRVDGVFSALSPTETLSAGAKRPLPPPAYIDAIRKGFEQAQIITFWVEAAIALRARRLWKDAETWLNRQEKDHTEAVDEARGLFWALSWTASLHVLEIPSTIDTLATLANRVRRRPELLSTVVLAPTQLSSWIQEAYGRKKVTAPCRSLKRFQDFFTKKLRKVLFCIANISNMHWILIRVDFDARTIAKLRTSRRLERFR